MTMSSEQDQPPTIADAEEAETGAETIRCYEGHTARYCSGCGGHVCSELCRHWTHGEYEGP